MPSAFFRLDRAGDDYVATDMAGRALAVGYFASAERAEAALAGVRDAAFAHVLIPEPARGETAKFRTYAVEPPGREARLSPTYTLITCRGARD